ncbi:MAG: hypothetical protein A2498_04735 [Lentisphaerae bacterium RIFOXYC12_FULL_60_16]|nr:MAG: hypothetical protein A2498_04735 [Lentisphaerae bacterium RIFOXYC12_FULL_60_16]OGV77935.1 MAG: hypothetical protein A2340_10215 [Lentisphaerae bacterium RIFOXYB12_FULL_60_10]
MALLATLTLMAIGTIHLLGLRFRAGDAFPPYSSLRSDPLGTRILHDSLARWENRTVERLYQPLESWMAPPDTTLLLAGCMPHDMAFLTASEQAALVQHVKSGGRVVFAFQPLIKEPLPSSPPVTNRLRRTRSPTPATPRADTTWGFTFARLPESAFGQPADRVDSTSATGLPTQIPCHTRLCFTNLATAWIPRYTVDNQPVVMERPLGAGRLVLVSPGYLLSNEALFRNRQTGFIAWIAGPHPRIVFDEQHLGISRMEGFMIRARSLGFGPTGIWFALCIVLLLARISRPLVPAPPSARTGRVVFVRQDSVTALINLLRRHIPRRNLLGTCLDTWHATAGRVPPATWQQAVDQLADEPDKPPRAADIVRRYRTLASLLNPAGRRDPAHTPQTKPDATRRPDHGYHPTA